MILKEFDFIMKLAHRIFFLYLDRNMLCAYIQCFSEVVVLALSTDSGTASFSLKYHVGLKFAITNLVHWFQWDSLVPTFFPFF